MVSALLSRFVIHGFGILYPAYRSYKAVKNRDDREYVKWMMYWIVFSLFLSVEVFADTLLSFFLPFYYLLKMMFVLWLLPFYTKGASILYRKAIHPTAVKYEKKIDKYLEEAQRQGYRAVFTIGGRALMSSKDWLLSTVFHINRYIPPPQDIDDNNRRVTVQQNSFQQRRNLLAVRGVEVQQEEDLIADLDLVDGGGLAGPSEPLQQPRIVEATAERLVLIEEEKEERVQMAVDKPLFVVVRSSMEVIPGGAEPEAPVRRSSRRRKPPEFFAEEFSSSSTESHVVPSPPRFVPLGTGAKVKKPRNGKPKKTSEQEGKTDPQQE